MRTEDLIERLAREPTLSSMSLTSAWRIAAVAAVIIVFAILSMSIGFRPDLNVAAETPRFLFKIVVGTALAVGAYRSLRVLSRPEGQSSSTLLPLALVFILISSGVVAELALAPLSGGSFAKLVGINPLACVSIIVLLGIGPLAIFIHVLRKGAPQHPAIAGATAGLLAGGIASGLFALNCPNNSALFVAVWYSIAIAALACLGAVAAWRYARW